MQPKMGSPFNLIFYSDDSVKAATMAAQSFHLIDSLNFIFSDYIPGSELNRLSASAGKDSFVLVTPLLYDILLTSKQASEKSGGAFDITIGPLSRLWRQARKENRFPSEDEIRTARELTGFDKVIIDTSIHRIKLMQQGMQLDPGGIGKGFVAQQVVDFLRSNGIHTMLAGAAGDIVCGEPPPAKKGWSIGVNIPDHANELMSNSIELSNKAVSTSGDVYQYIEHKGKKYSHIIDPRTGYGVTFRRNVTIIAKNGATADWLATACSILTIRKAKKLVKQYHAELLITQLKKKKIRVQTTAGMKAWWKKNRIE